MNVLSLFDGMSCGQIALNKSNIKYDNYFASEIDKHAIDVTQKNYPDTKQLGSVVEWRDWDMDWSSIDLLIGGSPCQGFSMAGKQLAFDDSRSKLFFVYMDILNHIRETNDKVLFLLENVKMRKDYLDIISDYTQVDYIKLNSGLVSAQNRQRYYWTNITGIKEPEDKNILLKDILEDIPYHMNESFNSKKVLILDKHNSTNGLKCCGGLIKTKLWLEDGNILQRNFSQGERIYSIGGKAPTISASSGGTAGAGNFLLTDDINSGNYRKITINEAERLQTVPDDYTLCEKVSQNQRFKMLGNGWTVDVIAHIFKNII